MPDDGASVRTELFQYFGTEWDSKQGRLLLGVALWIFSSYCGIFSVGAFGNLPAESERRPAKDAARFSALRCVPDNEGGRYMQ